MFSTRSLRVGHFGRCCAKGKLKSEFELFWRIFITVAVAGTVAGVRVVAVITVIALIAVMPVAAVLSVAAVVFITLRYRK